MSRSSGSSISPTSANVSAALLTAAEQGAFGQVRAAARLTRYGCDCYAYAMLAHGSIDLVAETGLAPWDVAALAPIVVGAGGEITDWEGGALTPAFFTDSDARAQVLAAGDPRPRDEALVALRRAARSA